MPVTVNTDLPLHPERDTAWDGDAARAAMARRCSSEDGVMADCMGAGFVWRDGDADASTIGAYSLPVADVFSGDLHLVLSGVQAAANAISPAREAGGPRAMSGSESELSSMRGAVETILRRFAREFDDDTIRAPWEAEPESERASAAAPVAAAGCCGGCGCSDTKTSDNTEAERPEPKQEGEAAMNIASVQNIELGRPRSRVIRASATGGEWRPPVDHFANPHLNEPTKLTVTADGRVYGHLATWDQPHIGYDGKLVYPPRNRDGAYGYFRQSQVVTADGSVVPVGILTMNTGHADESLSADAAAAHYDNTGTMMAACNVGEDSIGIWLAGSMLPDVSPELRNRFSLARVSGDWRQPKPGSPLELIAALSVPNPGFPVRQNAELLASDRLTLAASGLIKTEAGEIRTFICAGAAVVDEAQQAALTDAVRSAIGPDFIGQVKDAVMEALKSQADLTAKAPEPVVSGPPEAPAPESPAEPAAEAATEAPVDEELPGQDPLPMPEAAPAEAAAAPTDAGGAGALPAVDSAAAPAPPVPVEAAQVAASALARHLLKHRSASARQKLLAAAGRGKKA
jgi:hypothetical protein